MLKKFTKNREYYFSAVIYINLDFDLCIKSYENRSMFSILLRWIINLRNDVLTILKLRFYLFFVVCLLKDKILKIEHFNWYKFETNRYEYDKKVHKKNF